MDVTRDRLHRALPMRVDGARFLVPTLADTLIQSRRENVRASEETPPEEGSSEARISTRRRQTARERRRLWVSASKALQTTKWLREKRRIKTCGTLQCGGLIWGWKPGVKEFTGPVRCHSRWHVGCRVNNVVDLIRVLRPLGLLTLTWRGAQDELARDLCWCDCWPSWKKFHRWLERHGMNPGRYVAVVEPQESLMPHLHVATEFFPSENRRGAGWMQRRNKAGELIWVEVIDSFAPPEGYTCKCRSEGKPIAGLTHRVKDGWMRYGGGFSVTWERVYGSAVYIAKYLTKTDILPEPIQAMLTVNDMDLWSRSRGIELPEKPKSSYQLVRGEPGKLQSLVRSKA